METDDWVTPRLYGKPWFEKPPLYYWGAALCFKLFGVSEAAARLPSAISALLATLAMAWLALRLYGAETARWLLLLLPTTVGMIGFSHAAATDMPFSGMLTIAMVAAAVAIGLTRNENTPIIPRTPWLALFLFGVFLGAAVLAKGPAAIVLCGGAVFFWALFTKRWRDAFHLLHPAAIVAFCLTALPWYILCARRNPDFFRVFIIEHNFKRYLTPEFQHIQPFWYYGGVLLIALIPWTALFLWAAIAGLVYTMRLRRCSSEMLFLLGWAIFCVTFFSLSQSKLPGYILPAMPVIGLIVARSCLSLGTEHRKSFGATLLGYGLLIFGFAPLMDRLLPHISRGAAIFRDEVGMAVLILSLPSIILSIGFLFSRERHTRNLAVALSLIPALLPFGITDNRLISDLGLSRISSRDLAVQLKVPKVPTDQIVIYGTGRSWGYGLNFYLHRELQDWDQNPAKENFVLSGTFRCSPIRSLSYECTDVPLGSLSDGWFLSHITPKSSADSLPRSGQPQ
jgi:4-amino-4-deoxy-L-arabinose transferase-like glycosyltransferase